MGNKLKKIVNGTVSKDYCNGIEYNEGILEAIYHAEGRVAFEGEDSRYEYYLKDHLGNTRVIFSDLNNDGFLQPFNDGGGATPAFPNGTALYTEILQESHYYPFGMNMEGPWDGVESLPENGYLYNGKELNEDFGLDWLDYGARWYDPSIGRWNAVDPLAEKYYSISPYVYVANNPLKFIDPDGMQINPSDLKNNDEKNYNKLKNDLQNKTGVQLGINDQGNWEVTGVLKDDDGNQIGSEKAREVLVAAINDTEHTINIVDLDGENSHVSDDNGNTVNFNGDQFQGYMDNYQGASEAGEATTAGLGLGFLHELLHTDFAADKYNDGVRIIDPSPGSSETGQVVDMVNVMRGQLNLPQRTAYGPLRAKIRGMPYPGERNVVPFSRITADKAKQGFSLTKHDKYTY